MTGRENNCYTPWPEMGQAMRVYAEHGPSPTVANHHILITQEITMTDPDYIAFATNQRSEVRDLGEIAVSLSAEHGTNQTNYIVQQAEMTAVNFDEYNFTGGEETHHSIRAGTRQSTGVVVTTGESETRAIGFSHTQGLDCQPSEEHWPTLRAEGGGHAVAQPVTVYEPRSMGEENWTEQEVKNTLRAGASRSSHVVVESADPIICFPSNYSNQGITEDVSVTLTVGSSIGVPSPPAIVQPIAFSHYSSDASPSEELVPTLRSGTNMSGHAVAEPVAISENQRAELLLTPYARSLSTGGGKPGSGYPAVLQSTEPVIAPTLTASNDPSRSPQSSEVTRQVEAVYRASMIVRRLTPVECERLMGWPDDHTRWTADGTEVADTARYKMCGNGVASPVAEWVGRQIMPLLTD